MYMQSCTCTNPRVPSPTTAYHSVQCGKTNKCAVLLLALTAVATSLRVTGSVDLYCKGL